MIYFLEKQSRYYKIYLQKTLFNEYEVERIYGNKNYKSHTGSKCNVFKNESEAIKFIEKIKNTKVNNKKYKLLIT